MLNHQALTTLTWPSLPARSAAASMASEESREPSTPTTTCAGPAAWAADRSGGTTTTGHLACIAVVEAVVPSAAYARLCLPWLPSTIMAADLEALMRRLAAWPSGRTVLTLRPGTASRAAWAARRAVTSVSVSAIAVASSTPAPKGRSWV